MAGYVRVYDEFVGDPEGWLDHADDQVLACRGQGHAFPKLRPGRTRKGIRVTPAQQPQKQGCYQIEFTCRDCGTERMLITAPGGELDFPAKYAYKYPAGYKAPAGVSKRACLAKSWGRTIEAATAESATAGRLRAVPDPGFSEAAGQ